MRVILSLLALVSGTVGAASCAADGAGVGDAPQVVVTTTILGDVVARVVGEEAEVAVVLPPGADPHEFVPSARQAEAIAGADLLVINGAGFEQGLIDVIDSAAESGTPTFTFAEHVALRQAGGSTDPHLWLDPTAVSGAVDALGEALAEVEGIDAGAVARRADAYRAELAALDAEVEALLASIPPERRVLVTNHEVLGYFADRYGFEVIGAVIPSLSTGAEPSAADIEELAESVRARDVPAIFAETTQPATLAEALAEAVGRDVEVVELFSESLGDATTGADSYAGLVRTNAARIAAALA